MWNLRAGVKVLQPEEEPVQGVLGEKCIWKAQNMTESWNAQSQRSQENKQHNNDLICLRTSLYNQGKYSRQHVLKKRKAIYRANPMKHRNIFSDQIQYIKQTKM